MKLYQIAISHYCEVARWALKYLNVPYKPRYLLPGLHIPVIKKLVRSTPDSGKTSVPVLKDGKNVIQGTSAILDYLGNLQGQSVLMPSDPAQIKEVREWEKFADTQIGPHIRRCSYYFLLEHPDIVIPMLANKGPWYSRFLLKKMFPQLKSVMKRGMKIDEAGFKQSKQALDAAHEKLELHLKDREFLVGDSFTRADMMVAGLWAPLAQVEGYGIDWPATIPEGFNNFQNGYTPVLNWVKKIYQNYR